MAPGGPAPGPPWSSHGAHRGVFSVDTNPYVQTGSHLEIAPTQLHGRGPARRGAGSTLLAARPGRAWAGVLSKRVTLADVTCRSAEVGAW